MFSVSNSLEKLFIHVGLLRTFFITIFSFNLHVVLCIFFRYFVSLGFCMFTRE